MKTLKNILLVIFSFGIVILFITKLDYDNTKAFEYIITFLSIATGFNITAFSIFATSPFSGRLYTLEDANDNSRTLLHILVNKFTSSITLFLLTIGLILIFYFIEGDVKEAEHYTIQIREISITLPKILKGVIWYLTIVSSIKFNALLFLFSKFVIKSAPKT
jgi:hypothetical protein